MPIISPKNVALRIMVVIGSTDDNIPAVDAPSYRIPNCKSGIAPRVVRSEIYEAKLQDRGEKLKFISFTRTPKIKIVPLIMSIT